MQLHLMQHAKLKKMKYKNHFSLSFEYILYFQSLQIFNNELEKQISALKRQLESETLLRIDLENKNKTLREELAFNEQVHATVCLKLFLFSIK
jgi:hypothetical protein